MADKISYTLEEYKGILKESYEDVEFPDYSVEETFFKPLSKFIPLDKVEKVICLTSESNLKGEFELVHIVGSLASKLKKIGEFTDFLDGVIVREPVSGFFSDIVNSYIVEIIEPGMYCIDIFILKEEGE